MTANDSFPSDGSKIEVEDFDLLSVKSEAEEFTALHPKEENQGLSENSSLRKTKLSLTESILKCLLECKQLVLVLSDSSSQEKSCLVECPYCLWECKNLPDRLFQLVDHAEQIHEASLVTIIDYIFERYDHLIHSTMNEYLKVIFAP